MKIKHDVLFEKTSIIMFLFLFVLVVLLNYYSILTTGLTQSYNSVSIVSLFSASMLFIQILSKVFHSTKINRKGRYLLYLLIIFFAYVILWTFLHYISSVDNITILASLQSIELIILWLALIFIGYNLDLNDKWLKISLFLAVFISILVTLIFSSKIGTILIYYKLFFGDPDDVGTGYQYLARALLVVYVLTASIMKRSALKIAVILSGATLLFSIGSRSEFFAYSCSVIFLYVIDIFKEKVKVNKILSLIFLLIVVFILVNVFSESFLESRFSDIFDLTNSTSWSARSSNSDIAKKQILDSPIFGEFGGNINSNGISGYSHNVISAWVTYGFIGFMLYLSLNLYCIIISIKYYLIAGIESRLLWVIVFLSISMLILIIYSKAVFWPLPAFVWGLLLRYENNKISLIKG